MTDNEQEQWISIINQGILRAVVFLIIGTLIGTALSKLLLWIL